MVKDNITFIPPLRNDQHGWLNINSIIWNIDSIHSFDDFGASLDTLTVSHETLGTTEVYSHDECETFTLTPPL